MADGISVPTVWFVNVPGSCPLSGLMSEEEPGERTRIYVPKADTRITRARSRAILCFFTGCFAFSVSFPGTV